MHVQLGFFHCDRGVSVNWQLHSLTPSAIINCAWLRNELEAIIYGTHGDPFQYSRTASNWTDELGSARVPSAGDGRVGGCRWRCCIRCAKLHSDGFFVATLGAGSGSIQAAIHALERRCQSGSRRSVPLSAAALRIRSAPARRGHATTKATGPWARTWWNARECRASGSRCGRRTRK